MNKEPIHLQNEIDQSIDIAAPAATTWALVRTPGWWINTDTIRSHKIESEADIHRVHDEQYGIFTIRKVHEKEPEWVEFEWLATGEDTGIKGVPNTLVRFEVTGDGTRSTLRVIESGFLEGEISTERREEFYRENFEGWQVELAAARKYLEAGPEGRINL
jgi:hypothetical protein